MNVRVGQPFAQNIILRRLVWTYGAIWVFGAFSPVDRGTWLLENGLVFAGVGLLAATHRRFVFSNVSYGLIFVFLGLHVVGSHYTYSAVPLGDWIRAALDLQRNPYDRFVHFAFGLLLAYPLRELCLRIVHVHRIWSYVAPPAIVLSLSSLYEIVESWAARLAAPDLGLAFVGAQGDIWDGQKDMSLAFVGSLLAMGSVAAYRWKTDHEPYLHHSHHSHQE